MKRLLKPVIGLLHRAVWQRLPRSARRALLFAGSALVAPRPDKAAKGGLPLIFAGPLNTASGLGETSRHCIAVARKAGIATYGFDLTDTLMQTQDQRDHAYVDARGLAGPGTVILNANSPIVPLAMMKFGRAFVPQKRIIGYWAWELPDVPEEWRHGLPFVHEIWAPSLFTADAIRPIAGGIPVRVVPYPAFGETLPAPAPPRPEGRPFTVLTIFNVASSFARKNPVAAIKAFRQAFGDASDCRFIVKTANSALYPESRALLREAIGNAANIELIDASLPAAEVSALYDRADVVLSLHRSEGFGLVPAEGMMRGLPVVATNWSGNVDFCTAENGIPVGYTLIPAHDPQGTYDRPDMVWADPSVEEATAALRRLRDDPGLRARLGANGRAFALDAWSGETFLKTVLAGLPA